MTTAYPGALDSFTNPSAANNQSTSVGGRTHSAMHADINDAMEAVQAELGTDPAGTFSTVKDRLDAISGLWLPPIVLAENAYCLTDPAPLSALTTGNAGNAGGEAMGHPFAVDRAFTTDSVSVENTTAGAAGTFSRFMIYTADAATGKIGTLVFDSGQEAQDVTGVKTFSGTINWQPGHYWSISVRAGGAGAAANYRAFTLGRIPWATSAFDTSNKCFGLGTISSTSAPPSTWALSTYTPISRAPVALSLHVTAVS